MRKYLTMTMALVAGVACAVALAACGGGDKDLSSADAQTLLSILDGMQANADQGDCSSIASEASDAATQISQRGGLDSDLKKGLVAGFTNLAKLAENPANCEDTTATQTTTTEDTDTQTTESTQTRPDTTPDTVTTPPPTNTTTTTQSTQSNPTGGTPGGSGGVGL